MKKIYLAFFILLLCSLNGIVQAQCTYDMAWLATGRDGVWPDSATNFVSGTVGVPYSQNITVKVPDDTTYQSLTVHFAHIDLQTNISSPANYGLPPGLSLSGNPSNFHFPGNDTSCMIITGTPTTAGTYHLSFKLNVYMQEFGSIPLTSQTLTYYTIVINPPVGLSSVDAPVFEVGNPVPNPATSTSLIRYSLPKGGAAKLTVFNTLGKNILSKKADAKQGDNSFELNVSDLASGIYICSLEFEGKTITRRLIVNND